MVSTLPFAASFAMGASVFPPWPYGYGLGRRDHLPRCPHAR